jgi:C1A family cysteine protease
MMGLGWLPDLPDIRDYTAEHPKVGHLLERLENAGAAGELPSAVDLRTWCSPVENQGKLGSCTAHAGVGMYEYFERRAFGKHIDASRLFLYKTTRNLLRWTGDRGATLRSTMEALTLFGLPLEEYWPYLPADFDEEPTPFHYAMAQNFQALTYFRLDPPGIAGDELLKAVKKRIASGFVAMFGFTVYISIDQATATGRVPYPVTGEKTRGGHAVLAVGYDDSLTIRNSNPGATVTIGALLIRNSWGVEWGSGGYGWLPYEYVLKGLAIDWWTMVKGEWVDTDAFG